MSAIAELLEALSKRPGSVGSIMVCYSKCEPCKWGEHSGRRHTWADEEDIAHARATGQADPSTSICGCYCQRSYRRLLTPHAPKQLIHKGGKP